MTKNQFLEKLRAALSGKVPSDLVTENLRYYEDYINTEIRKGKTEGEVLEGLGDPRLIARTIVETRGGSGAWSEDASEESGSYKDEEREYHIHGHSGSMRPGLFFRLPVWVWLLIVLVIVILILSVIFSVLAAVLPVLLPILLVLFLVKLFRDWIS